MCGRAGLGASEHTTILLNCYTKLGDASKMAAFLQASAADMPFDLDAAIRVLSGAAHADAALKLAKDHSRHDLTLAILLDNKGDAKGALDHLASLDRPTVSSPRPHTKRGDGLQFAPGFRAAQKVRQVPRGCGAPEDPGPAQGHLLWYCPIRWDRQLFFNC